MNNDIYTMKLHDEITLYRGLEVVRVPGGWLYRFGSERSDGDWSITATFVPFDNEYHPSNINKY